VPPDRSLAARYGCAVAVTIVGVGVRMTLAPLWGLHLPLITFFPAMMASAWFGGLGPGLNCTRAAQPQSPHLIRSGESPALVDGA
jgi:hypothetical protein